MCLHFCILMYLMNGNSPIDALGFDLFLLWYLANGDHLLSMDCLEPLPTET